MVPGRHGTTYRSETRYTVDAASILKVQQEATGMIHAALRDDCPMLAHLASAAEPEHLRA